MQTLSVGARRTDTEYKEAEEQRCADLGADSRSDANFFFWASCARNRPASAAEYFVRIGAIDLLSFYGKPLGPLSPLALHAAAAMWVVVLLALGFAGRGGHRWAFLAGMVLYGADMIALDAIFGIQMVPRTKKSLKDLNEAHIQTF